MNARQQERHKIHLEELAGRFSLFAGDTQFDFMRVNDVSPGGAGLLISQPLAIGTKVRLTFSAGDWHVSVDGDIVWCRRQSLPLSHSEMQDNFRLGVQLHHHDTQSNMTFFNASKSTLKKFH